MKSFEERLEAESVEWVADGLIDVAQRGRLLARHPVRAGGAKRFLTVLASVGGVLVTVGISLVIKSNWERIGDWVKIGGLVALLVSAAAAGWRLKLSPGHYPKTGDACLMAAAGLFLLGIVLVSQIFHLESRPANGVLLWWAGIVALPWLARARGAQLVSIVAGLVWLGLELGSHDSWLSLTRDGASAGEGIRFNAAGVFAGLAVALFGRGLRKGAWEDFAEVHEGAGLVLMNFSLYGLGFTWSVQHWFYQMPHDTRWQPVVVLLALVIAAGSWAWRKNAAAVKPLAWFFGAALLPAVAQLFGIDLHDDGWLWGGIACGVLFLLDLGLIRAGLAEGREDWINLGIIFIALNVVTRYFLLFGTLLEGGVFFIVTGLLVLGLGFYLERKRRALVGRARKEAVS